MYDNLINLQEIVNLMINNSSVIDCLKFLKTNWTSISYAYTIISYFYSYFQ